MSKIKYLGNTSGMVVFDYDDIQKLSKKYFGDELTEKESIALRRICHPSDWSRVDDGGYEGCLGQLISAVVSIIGLVRADRRSKDIPLPTDLPEEISDDRGGSLSIPMGGTNWK